MAAFDVSDDFEAALLKRLDEYGQSLLDEKDYEKRKRKINKKQKLPSTKIENITEVSVSASEDNTKVNRKKKKRKKKNLAQNLDSRLKSNEQANAGKTKAEKKIIQLKHELGISEENLETLKLMKCENIISEEELIGAKKIKPEIPFLKIKRETECAVVSSEMVSKHSPEVFVYKNPSKRKTKQDLSDGEASDNSNPDFNLKQARYDVRKLGINGMNDVKKEEAMVSLLCSLGAKAPKKKFYNYKEFQDMRKKEIEELQTKRQVDRSLGLNPTAPKKGRKRPKDKNDIGTVDGQVGKYKKGVQIIKKQELKGFKKRKQN